MRPRISVVVPVYNVEEYLPRSLDSLYDQCEEGVEVILVNDGSTDGSPALCRKYQAQYPATLIIDKPNGGLSDARNAGTLVASGQYVYYLDSDDWLAPNALKRLYDYAEAGQCDVVQGAFYYAYDHYLLYDDRWLGEQASPFVLDRAQAMEQLLKNQYVKNFAWGKLYKADLVKKYPFEKGKYFEDAFWQHRILHETTRYGIVSEPLYYYRQRESSISGAFSLKNLDLLRGNEQRLQFIKANYPQLRNLCARSFWNLCQDYRAYARQSADEHVRKAFEEYIGRISNQYHLDFDTALRGDVAYRLGKCSPLLLRGWQQAARVYNHFFGKRLKRLPC